MGKIIVIEGTDGSGKETQSKLLVDYLKKQGQKVVEFSFPMYESPTGTIFKDCVLGKNDVSIFPEGYEKIDPEVVCLYTAADRKYNSKKIQEYLDQDYYVILNRYTSSNMAHQGSKYEDSDERFYMYQWIDKLEYWLLKLPKPDYTFLLNIPYEYRIEWKEKQIFFDFDSKKKEEEDKILASYLELAGLYHWDVIDCVKGSHSKSIEEIHQEIVRLLTEKYHLFDKK